MARSESKARLRARTASEKFKRRLESPDLDGLEQHLGRPLPVSFRAMYRDRGLILSNNLLIAVSNPLEPAHECYIAWFEPADIENFRAVWPGYSRVEILGDVRHEC